MRRRLPYCGLTYTTLAILAGFALHELSLDDGRADDPNQAGVKAKAANQPQKKVAKKRGADVTALRAERALARRAAIAQEDAFGPGSDFLGYAGAGGKANGNASGSSAFGGSAFGSAAGPFSGSALGSSQVSGSSSGTTASSSSGTAGGTTTAGSGSGTGTTGGQGQSGTGSTSIPYLNQKVLEFATSHLGQQVGNGQCWELGAEALAYANAEPPHGQVFGDAVPVASTLPGDILEFDNAHFVGANYWLSLGAPYHTAIVSAVEGNSIAMLNQNVNNVKRVQITIIHLADMQSGTMTVYRPAARQ